MTVTHLERTVLRAEGFTCPACVFTVQRELFGLTGVQEVTLHFGAGLVEIKHDGRVVEADRLVQAVADAGYRSTVTTT